MNQLSNPTKTLIIIAGPTASGKTALAIQLARHLDTEIISADSRQFYSQMAIGTAKPSHQELAAAKHHFISSHSVTERFNVGDFEKQSLELLDELFATHQTVIMAGGSGLYIKAVTEGFDELPAVDAAIRESLNQQFSEKGIEFLQEQLKNSDPDYYQHVDLSNPQRLVRALEVFQASGRPFSSYRKAAVNKRKFNSIKIGLDWPREMLYQRINQRVDDMMEQGLLDEVRSLTLYRGMNALNTVGYSELFAYLDGSFDLDTATRLIKQHTRQFAKRQLTWFRKDKQIKWFRADAPELAESIFKELSFLKQVF